MVQKRKSGSKLDVFTALNDGVRASVPQVFDTVHDSEDFISLLVKLQPDGTCLGVLKCYGSDGTPMVCFGGGYGLAGCLVALEGTLAADKWRVDTPWKDRDK